MLNMRFYYYVIFPNINSSMHEYAISLSFGNMCIIHHLACSTELILVIIITFLYYFVVLIKTNSTQRKKIWITCYTILITRYESHLIFLIFLIRFHARIYLWFYYYRTSVPRTYYNRHFNRFRWDTTEARSNDSTDSTKSNAF